MQAIRDKIEPLRKALGISIKEMAERAGISEQGYYSRLRSETLDVKVLIALAEVLQVPAAELLPDAHRGEVLHRKPEGRPYVEDRLEQLEREVRGMRQELKRKH